MAEEASAISRKITINTTDFKTGISEINRYVRLMESEFRSSAAGLQNWAKDATGLETRIKTLNSQIDLQKQKVALLAAEHQRVAEAEGVNSKGATDLEFKLNAATGALNKMELELGQDERALEEMRSSTNAVASTLGVLGAAANLAATGGLALLRGTAKALVVELRTVATVIKGEVAAAFTVLKVGVGAIVGVGAAAVLAGALIGGLGLKAATAADQLGELAEKSGISVQRLQELSFTGAIVGTDLDTIVGANARMIRSMQSAVDGTGAQAEAFKKLGVRIRDSHGQLRDANTVFGETIDALGQIENPTLRDALAMEIFGRSAQELNPLINAGSAGLKNYAQQAREFGAVVDEKVLGQLGDLRDNFDRLKLGLQGTGTTILGALAPFMNGAIDGALGELKELVKIVQTSGGDPEKLMLGLGGFATHLVQSLAQAMPEITNAGVEIVKTLATSFTANLPDLLSAGRTILVTIVGAIVQNLPAIAEAAPAVIQMLADAFLKALPVLFTVGEQILLTLVRIIGQVLPGLLPRMAATGLAIIRGLLDALRQAFPIIAELVPQILQTLIDFLLQNLQMLIEVGVPMITGLIEAILPALPLLVDAALQILVALANAIADQLPRITPTIEKVVIQIVEVLAKNAPLLIKAAGRLIVGLLKGLAAGIPTVMAEAPALIMALVDGLLSSLGELAVAGLAIVVAILDGYKAAFGNISPVARDFISEVVDRLLSAVSILWSVGKAIVEAIWKGIQDNASAFVNKLIAWLESIFPGLPGLLGIKPPSGGGGGGGGGGKVRDLLSDLQGQFEAASISLSGPTRATASSTTNNSENFTFYAPVVVQSPADGKDLASKLKGRRF